MNCIIVDDEPLGRKATQLLAKETPVLNILGSFGDADSVGKFIHENKSYIVNMKQIESFDTNDIFIGRHEIAIGNSYRESFLNQTRSI